MKLIKKEDIKTFEEYKVKTKTGDGVYIDTVARLTLKDSDEEFRVVMGGAGRLWVTINNRYLDKTDMYLNFKY